MKSYLIKEISDNLYLIRFNDKNIRYFEGIWEIPEGITYNSYVYIGEKKIVFDTVKSEYSHEYIDALSEVISPKKIDYIIIHHAEPDHTGALPMLLEESRADSKIIGHALTEKILRNLYEKINFMFKPVKDMEKIIKGVNELIILHTPWLHWPETIMSYFSNKGILLSCDAFGGYSIPSEVYDEDIEDYVYYMRKYLVTVIGSYIEWVPKTLSKFDRLRIQPKMILPSHGIIWSKNPSKAIKLYREWSSKRMNKRIFIMYSTMYGKSRRIAEFIEKLIKENRIEVKAMGFDDKIHPNMSDLLTEAHISSGYVLISPTYESDIHPLMKSFLVNMVNKVKPCKPVLIISPFGWSGVAGRKIYNILKENGFEKISYYDISGGIERNRDSIKRAVKDFLKEM